MEKKGFLLGRTDPNTDPQGRSFIYMIELAQSYCHLPSDTVTKILGSPLASTSSPQVFAETSLLAHLQAGQLDASSAYLSQARQLHLHYIVLPAAINLGDASMADAYHKASITITGNVTKHGSPLAYVMTIIGKPTSAGTAFVAYALSPAGRALYAKEGYNLMTPTITGDASAVPAAIKAEAKRVAVRELGGQAGPGATQVSGAALAPAVRSVSSAVSLVAAAVIWIALLGPVIALFFHITPHAVSTALRGSRGARRRWWCRCSRA